MGRNSHTYEKLVSDSAQLLSQDEQEFGAMRKFTLSRGFPVITKSPKIIVALAIPFITMMVTIVLGGILLSRTWKPSLSQITITTGIPPGYCGTTPAEARAAGCMFEANNFAWLHPLCYSADLEKDWRHGPWSSDLEFWKEHGENWDGIGRIAPEEAFKGEIETVWVNTLQHRRHCLHTWKKYVIFANQRLPIDSWTVESEHHVDHCVMLLRDFNNTSPDERVSSKLSLKYPSCEYGPVAIHITPNGWTREQVRLHHP